jgi:MFS family permease
MFHRLINQLGFGWTTRIMAFIGLAGLIFAVAVMKLRLPPPKTARRLFDLSAFKEPAFMLFAMGMFFAFIGLYLPFFYMPTFFISYLHKNDSMAFYIIAVLNGASVFGRVTPGILADKVGSLNTLIPVGFITSILAFAWIGIDNEPGTIVFAVFYGFASGAMVSLPPTVIARLTPDMSLVGTRMGMTFIFGGVGLLIGNPIAGTLLEFKTPTDAVFWRAQLFSSVMVLTGTIFFTALRVVKWKQGHGWKI